MSALYKSESGAALVRERYAKILQHWPVPNQQVRVPTSQGETFVIACGPEDAPPVVLLHGTMINSSMWMREAAILSARFRVFAVDIIGDGGSSAESRPSFKTDAHAKWLEDVLRELGIPQGTKIAFVGISLGGWLALDFATRFPERVSQLVLLCPAGLSRSKNVLLWVLPLMLLGPWGRRRIRQRILGPGPSGPVSPAVQYYLDFITLIFKNLRPRTEKMPMIEDAALRRLGMPTLVILGAKDVMLDSVQARRRVEAHVARGTIDWLAEAGHNLGDQSQRIVAFLDR
jgi:pimeloyl-ACP methyl ester carboxylesterase